MCTTRFGTIALFILSILLGCSQSNHGILYQSGSTIWSLSPAQGTKHKIFEPAPDVIAISTDTRKVAFSTDGSDLWIADTNWENQRSVPIDEIKSRRLQISKIAWSSDNKAIATWAVPIENPHSNPERFELDVVQLSDMQVQKIAVGITTFAWMPSENHLVIVKRFDPDPQAGTGIYVIDVDGSITQSLFNGLAEPYISVSKNGQIAFVVYKSKTDPILRLMVYDPQTMKTTDVIREVNFTFHSISYPTWSPDGEHLAFTAHSTGNEGTNLGGLFVVNLKTGTVTEIAKNIRGPLAWAPDGKAIATPQLNEKQGIYEIPLDTMRLRQITSDKVDTLSIFDWR